MACTTTGCENCGTEPVLDPGCDKYDDIEIPEIDPEDEIPEISPDDVTTEVVDGTGVFDIYMRAGMNQLDTQWKAGRIKGADYAAAYIETMKLMMEQANMFVVQTFDSKMKARMFGYELHKSKYAAVLAEASAKKMAAEADLICNQIAELQANGREERALKKAQTNTQMKQVNLYDRQIKGYDETALNASGKTIMDAWAVQLVEFSNTADQIVSVGQGAYSSLSACMAANDCGCD